MAAGDDVSDLPQAVRVAAGMWLEPLAAAAREPAYRRDLFAALGLDADGFDDNGVARLAAELARATEAAAALAAADLSEASPETLVQLLETVESGVESARAAAGVAADLDDAVSDAQELLERLLGFLTVAYLAAYAPAAYDVAVLLGLIRIEARPDGDHPRLDLARLPALIADPHVLAEHYLGPGGIAGLERREDAIAAADRLLPPVANLLRRAGVNARYSRDVRLPLPLDPGLADRRLTIELPLGASFGAGVIVSLRSAAEGGAGVVLAPFGAARFEHDGAGWDASLELESSVRGLAVGPGGVEFPAGATTPRVAVHAEAVKRKGAGGVGFRTSATGSRLEIGGIVLRADAEFAGAYEIELLAELTEAKLVIDGGPLEPLLPEGGLRVDFALGIGWSRRNGLFFAGGASLDTVLAVHRAIGPLRIELVHLSARAGEQGLTARLGATAGLTLGPVRVLLERAGLAADITFPAAGGNLGPAHATLRAEPPAGAAVSVEAGAVTGGGVLIFDAEAQQYAGALQLQFEGLTLSAIGLLSTRMPDGSPGFSLLAIVRATGFAPIPLGFGFRLTGVGGLLAINRTASVDVVRAGLRDRSLDALFTLPEGAAQQAPAVVGALQRVFPPAADRHVFGPLVQLEWGTPPLVTIDAALMLELPAPLRLLVAARAQAALPNRKRPVVDLRLDAFGVLDFERREVAVDASLVESTIAGFTLTGDAAIRASFGARPDFALSVGGFHPGYSAPPAFPALRRLALTLAAVQNPRLRLEAYLALTPNSVQLGARLELSAAVGGLSLEGLLAFDTLVQLSPFGFESDLAAVVALKKGTSTLMGVDVRLRLSGPAPWRAVGTATFQLLLLRQTVAFDASFGTAGELEEEPEVELLPLLTGALSDGSSWRTSGPADAARLVSLAGTAASDGEVMVHPLGAVEVRQRSVPLDREIARVGAARVRGGRRLRIAAAKVGTADGELRTVTEPFAPGEFFDLSDAERLASPAFDPMPAGARVDGGAPLAGPSRSAEVAYDTAILQAPRALAGGQTSSGPRYAPNAAAVAAMARIGPAALAASRTGGRARYSVPGAPVAEPVPRYAVATSAGLGRPAADGAVDGSWSGAREAIRRAPDGRERLQVVTTQELVA